MQLILFSIGYLSYNPYYPEPFCVEVLKLHNGNLCPILLFKFSHNDILETTIEFFSIRRWSFFQLRIVRSWRGRDFHFQVFFIPFRFLEKETKNSDDDVPF